MTSPLDPRVTRFLFEGEMLTARQVHAIVPAVSISAIRRMLKAGHTDRFQILDGIAALKAESRRRQIAGGRLCRPRL
jgi:hypothetical protein